jgi:acetyl/propionyl-CoA carboxylase alpha subunit
MTMAAIKRVFIANRGEIARRIALGARNLGIEVAVIYSGEVPPAFLEGLVQRFIKVPEENPALYLNAELMIDLAKQAECDAVHPGFGFLSENARLG